MLSKKYYTKFADMLVKRFDEIGTDNPYHKDEQGYLQALQDIKFDLINLFSADNPAFDSARFTAYIDKRVKELTRKD